MLKVSEVYIFNTSLSLSVDGGVYNAESQRERLTLYRTIDLC